MATLKVFGRKSLSSTKVKQHMPLLSKQTLRLMLMLILFQFFAPSFFLGDAQVTYHKAELAYYPIQNSIIGAVFLTEKEEVECEKSICVHNPVPLLDLVVQVSNLNSFHNKYTVLPHVVLGKGQSPLFALNRVYLI